jgi:copper(I)-binding protein
MMNARYLAAACLPLLLAGLGWPASVTACAGIEVTHAWVREMPPGVNVTAAYLDLVNTSDHEVMITHVSSPRFQRGEFHATRMENGNMSMEELRHVVVPAHGRFSFRPDGYHIMLFNPHKPPAAGGIVTLELACPDGRLSLKAPVRRRNFGEDGEHPHE